MLERKRPRFQGEKPGLRGDLAMYLTLGTIVLWSERESYIHFYKKIFVLLDDFIYNEMNRIEKEAWVIYIEESDLISHKIQSKLNRKN